MPSLKTFNELVTQTPFPATPTVTETPTATSTSTATNTVEPTTSNTPTETATKEPTATSTVKPTETPTQVPTKIPEPSPTIKPTEIPAKPSPAPTIAPAKPTIAPTLAPTPKPEAPSVAFPKEIGNLDRDSFAIHNKGNQYGMIARDFAYLSQMAKKYGVKVEVFLYDNHGDNPYDQVALITAVSRNPNGWGIHYGKEASLRAPNGVIQLYLTFNDDIKQIVSGQIFPNDQYAQFRKESIEGGISAKIALIYRFKAPRSEWPKSWGPASEDLLKISNPLPNLQLAISP